MVLGVGGWAVSALAAPLARVTNSNWTIEAVNVATNADAPYGSLSFFTDSLGQTASGQLDTADPNGNLWDVTGPAIPAGTTGMAGIADLDGDASGLWGYSNTAATFFYFDTGSMAITYSQSISAPSGITISGVAHQASTGDTYLSGYDAAYASFLYVLPNATSSLTLVGTLAHGDGASYITDVEFDAAGTLYAMTWYHRHFLTVNPLSAATSTVSTGPHRDSTAFALAQVPEPASALALLGLVGGLLRRRR